MLTPPFTAANVVDLGNVQRSFTARVDLVKPLNYWERLSSPALFPLAQIGDMITIYS